MTLAELLTSRDFAAALVTKKDRQRLRRMVAFVEADRELLLEVPTARTSLQRLATAAGLAI